MAVFSAHSDALFRIGVPAAQKATLWLSPVGGVIWYGIIAYRMLRDERNRLADDEDHVLDEDE